MVTICGPFIISASIMVLITIDNVAYCICARRRTEQAINEARAAELSKRARRA